MIITKQIPFSEALLLMEANRGFLTLPGLTAATPDELRTAFEALGWEIDLEPEAAEVLEDADDAKDDEEADQPDSNAPEAEQEAASANGASDTPEVAPEATEATKEPRKGK